MKIDTGSFSKTNTWTPTLTDFMKKNYVNLKYEINTVSTASGMQQFYEVNMTAKSSPQKRIFKTSRIIRRLFN